MKEEHKMENIKDQRLRRALSLEADPMKYFNKKNKPEGIGSIDDSLQEVYPVEFPCSSSSLTSFYPLQESVSSSLSEAKEKYVIYSSSSVNTSDQYQSPVVSCSNLMKGSPNSSFSINECQSAAVVNKCQVQTNGNTFSFLNFDKKQVEKTQDGVFQGSHGNFAQERMYKSSSPGSSNNFKRKSLSSSENIVNGDQQHDSPQPSASKLQRTLEKSDISAEASRLMKQYNNIKPSAPTNKMQRYKRTADVLKSSGLMDVTMKTADLLKRNKEIQSDINSLKKEWQSLFVNILNNGENEHVKDHLYPDINL